jgi:hypothetical protein
VSKWAVLWDTDWKQWAVVDPDGETQSYTDDWRRAMKWVWEYIADEARDKTFLEDNE